MKNIGLKRHTVKLVMHQSSWIDIFNETKEELQHLIGKYSEDIRHIGSTSISSIVAKPIIDIAIMIPTKESIVEIIPILEKNNFEYRGDSKGEGGHLFVRSSEPSVRTHHLHIVEKNDVQWQNYLFFRDALIKNKDLAKAYSELKLSLSIRFPKDRKSYTNGKERFIKQVLSLNQFTEK